MADDISKIAWLDAVLADPAVSFRGFAAAYVLAMRFSHFSEWPDLELMAEDIGRKVRSTQDAVREQSRPAISESGEVAGADRTNTG